MGQSENRHEAKRWLDTANEDYETALYLLKGKKYSHSCFYCQQTGEKSLKALWFYMDLEPWGHSVTKLILDFPKMEMISFSEELTSAARSRSSPESLEFEKRNPARKIVLAKKFHKTEVPNEEQDKRSSKRSRHKIRFG